MSMLKWMTVSLLLTMTPALGCGAADGEETSEETPSEETPSEETTEEAFFQVESEREGFSKGEIDRALVEGLRDANTASAFRFYRELRTEESNLIFSPFSFSRVFAGYYDGEREAEAFEALFGFTPDVATLEAWQQLYHLASDRSEFSDTPADERSAFVASDIYWVDESTEGEAGWDYFDYVHSLPLEADPESARQKINDWIESESVGMLEDYLEPGSTVDANAVATNLVYFVGAWPDGEYEAAEDISFQGLDGATDVSAFGGYVETQAHVGEDVTVVRLPYAHRYSHWIIMPHSDFEAFANAMDETVWSELKGATSDYGVTFTVPEFSADSKPAVVAAVDTLRAETGTEGGTLSGAHTESYVHQAAIEFTKEGTRAAATSAVTEYHNNAPGPPEALTVTFDRPFVHVVTDDRSGSILFLGEYTGG